MKCEESYKTAAIIIKNSEAKTKKFFTPISNDVWSNERHFGVKKENDWYGLITKATSWNVDQKFQISNTKSSQGDTLTTELRFEHDERRKKNSI